MKRRRYLRMLSLMFAVSVLMLISQTRFAKAAALCGATDTMSVMGGEYIIQNNIWGATTPQCIDVPSTSTNNWSVTSSSHNQGSVASYPSVFKGCHWGLCSVNSGMPIPVNQVGSAPFSWSVTKISNGTWNVAAEAWFSPITDSTDGYNGGAELMIWLDYQGMSPAGSQVGTVSIGGATWEVWYANIGWNYIAYRRVGAVSSINADLKSFINDSVARGYIQPTWYLHDFEAGFELMTGGAGFVSNAFTFAVNTTSSDTQAPTVPSNLVSPSKTANSVSLTWSASTDNVGVTGYNVYRGATLVGSPATTSFTDTGLTANTAYSYTVRARDAAGNLSAASAALSVTTLAPTTPPPTTPPPSGSLKVQYKAADTSAGDNQIKPHFNIVNTGSSSVPMSELTLRYWFTREGSTGMQFNCDYAVKGCGNVTGAFTSITAVTGANYYLQLSFASGAGSIAASSSSGEIQARINKTDWSNFNESDDYSFDATKTAFADWSKVTLYRNGVLIWGTEPTGGTPPPTTPPPTTPPPTTPPPTTPPPTTPPPTTPPPTTPPPTTPPPTTPPPTTPPPSGSLKVQYKAADTNAGDGQIKPHFNIVNTGSSSVPMSELTVRYWFTREGSTAMQFHCDYAVKGCGNLSGAFTSITAVTGANHYLQVSFSSGAGSIAAGGSSGEIQARFNKTDWSNFNESDDYSFDATKTAFADWSRVTLYRNGVLIWGTEPTGGTPPPTTPPPTTPPPTDTQAPSVPTNLTSPSKTATSVSLTWTASTDNVGVTGYDVYRGATLVGSPTTTSFTDTGLTANTAYSYTVRAKDAAGNISAASAALSVTTSTSGDTQPPTAPTNLASPSKTSTTISLTWTASTDNVGVTSYGIYRGITLVGTATSTSFTDSGLTPNTSYSYVVQARDAAGNSSASSNLLSVTTSTGGTDPVHVDNPFVGATIYKNVDYVASVNAAADLNPALGARMRQVATYPTFVWLDSIDAVNGTNGYPRSLIGHMQQAVAQGATAIQIVVYDLPNRDCSALASNGELLIAQDGFNRYKNEYINPIASAIAQFPNLRVIAVVEPDSLPNLHTNLSFAKCQEANGPGGYRDAIVYALNTLGANANFYAYIDVAHHGWLGWQDSNFIPAGTLIANVIKSTTKGVNSIDGFVTNTANTSALVEPYHTANQSVGGQPARSAKYHDWNTYIDELSYAQAWRTMMIGNGFPSTIGMIIDTSRNGWGGPNRPTAPSLSTVLNVFVDESRIDRRIHKGNWCNQSGAGIGERPTVNPASGLDAYVWVKPPGESDGSSSLVPVGPENPGGKGFDRMCDPTYTGNSLNGNSMTGALPNAPVSGRWFQAQFEELVRNAYPAFP